MNIGGAQWKEYERIIVDQPYLYHNIFYESVLHDMCPATVCVMAFFCLNYFSPAQATTKYIIPSESARSHDDAHQ